MIISDVEIGNVLGIPLSFETLPERALWSAVLMRAASDYVNFKDPEIIAWFNAESDEPGSYTFCLRACSIEHLRTSIIKRLNALRGNVKLRKHRSSQM
jgi:hypothetical protein